MCPSRQEGGPEEHGEEDGAEQLGLVVLGRDDAEGARAKVRKEAPDFGGAEQKSRQQRKAVRTIVLPTWALTLSVQEGLSVTT